VYKAIWKDGEVKGAKERTVAVKKLHALPAGAEPIREFCKEVVLMQVTGAATAITSSTSTSTSPPSHILPPS